MERDFIIGSRPRRYVGDPPAYAPIPPPPRCSEYPSVRPVGNYTCPRCGERSYWNAPTGPGNLNG